MVIVNGRKVLSAKIVTKVEVVSDGFPIQCATEDEMTSVLENATEESVGKLYKFVGESTETYEQNAIYIIEAAEAEATEEATE